ncbi:protein FAR1-RELATED SEQUENCE 8-like [Actinidia eriantha]|uniref:protein FAR1-RELATED SEQUENCE 8-like n=1 Tax=Actinidia eriantha TaxID=165200 RepID=UPI00258F3338|nr:protein FAR1-RELATED SEQUENCE 8-like [Actinidia eriantha]
MGSDVLHTAPHCVNTILQGPYQKKAEIGQGKTNLSDFDTTPGSASTTMTGDRGFSPIGGDLPPSPDLDITISEGSEDSEQLFEEEGSEHEIDSEQIFAIESNDFEDGSEQVLGIASNDLCSDSEQVLEFGSNDEGNNSKQVFGIESNKHENNCDQVLEIDSHYHGSSRTCGTTNVCDHNGVSQGKGYPPPVVGMEFESYDDAYNYYNCYAKESGFAIRVKSSWTKRNSKEKRGAVLCCNCEGFKTIKEASSRRKETRTGCLAMIRLRLVESNRWRVDEAKLEHNHSFDPERAQNSKSHKKMDAGVKRKLEPPPDVEVRTIKLYRTPVVDIVGYGSLSEKEMSNHVGQSRRLKLNNGDAQVINNYFCRVQLTNPNFFYVMDLNDDGLLRNVFWIDSRSRAAYGYFGDVVALDTTCLSNQFEIPLLSFVGVNHHGQSILLGCGLLADETLETYIWLLRAWLTCMLGRPPQTIITDHCKALQTAVAEIFPRAHHRLCLSNVIQSILRDFGEVEESEVFRTVLSRTVHNCIKVDEFEVAWENMIQRFGIRDHEWLRTLYEDREQWAPVYSKDTFFAGMFTSQPGEITSPFFDGYVHKQTTLKEFFDMYELVLQKKYQKESLDDFESKESSPMLKTSCPYELPLSEMYTKEIFLKFQEEVEMMASCLSVTQIHANGPIITYMVKEQEEDGDLRGIRNFEVMYDKAGVEVRCICSCFNFKGYLCRHALCVLNYNRVDEIPIQYVLSRWRKDFKRMYVPDLGSNSIDITNPVQWFDHLYKRALQVVEEGMTSQDHYMVAWQAFKESLNKVRLVTDKHV